MTTTIQSHRRTGDTRAERPSWAERPTVIGRIAKFLVLTAVTLAALIPIYVVTLTSLSSRQAIDASGGVVFVPAGFSLSAYAEVLSSGVVIRALLVSTGVTVIGTAISLVTTAMAAYGLSRPGSFGHRPVLFLVLLTFLFAPGIIPSYLTLQALGMLNTYSSLILPGAVAAFQLIVLRTFFMQVPNEILDSARVDGASDFRVFFSIIVPLSGAVLAVIALFYGVGYWNAFFNAMLYLNDTEKYPLQVILRVYVLQGSPLPGAAGSATAVNAASNVPAAAASVKMAIVVIALLPIVMIYPLVQRHFGKVVITGAVKG